MLRLSYYREEDLKEYEPLGIIKTEQIKGPHGDMRNYVTFGKGLVLHWGSDRSIGGDPTNGVMVWHPVKKKPVGHGWQYADMVRDSNEILEVDATPEIKAEYEAYQAEKERLRKEAHQRYKEQVAREREKVPARGKFAKVVRGRKVSKGAVGEIFWIQPLHQARWGQSVGLELANGTRVFTYLKNIEVIKPEAVPAE